MSLSRLSLVPLMLAAGLFLTACDQIRLPGAGDQSAEPKMPALETDPQTEEETAAAEPELPVRPASATEDTAIDWEAARRDLAARPLETREGAFQVASGEAAPPVPVFLPEMPVGAQSGESNVRFQPMSDGYYAFIPGEAYDTIVNGTNKVIAAPGEEKAERTEAFIFQPTTTGAQVSFSRYGADYLVEYECKELTNGLPTCITQEEAVSFAEELVISGTR